MKITAVLGSPHREGNTCTVARWVLEAASACGAEVEEIFLAEKHIEYCRGCISKDNKIMCMSQGGCVIPDDVNRLRDTLYDSDGIVLASPSYGIMPTARMKNFLVDRIGMFTVYTSGLAGKYFVGISTAGGIGAKKVAKGLADHFVVGFFQRGFMSGYLHAHLGYGHAREAGRLEERARRLGKKLVEDIRNKKRYPFQRLSERILTRVMVRRIILRNIRENKDGRLKAVYQNLAERKLIPE